MNIKQFLEALKQMRIVYKKNPPPIVTLIAETTKDPYRVLISTILSLRTKDETTAKASRRLFKVATTPKQMVKISENELIKLIYPVGFYKTKAPRIIEMSKEILENHNGIVPNTLDELLKFKGVGRKTANLVLSDGYGKAAICVDTHVHRIFNRFELVKTKTPEETEFALMDIVPKKYWKEINYLMVGYGQTICRPVGPKCNFCKVGNCPSRREK